MIIEIGFGIPKTQDFARFTILADFNSGVYGAWMPQVSAVQDAIVGSAHSEVQITHVGVSPLTLRLRFDSQADYFKLQAMLTKKRTLVLYKGFVPHEGETYHWRGRDYELYPETLLRNLSPSFGVGDTEATAEFWRAPDRMGITL